MKKTLLLLVLLLSAPYMGSAAITLSDNFDDNSFDTAKWNTYAASTGLITETNQQLQINVQPYTLDDYAGAESDVTYDFDETSAYVKLKSTSRAGVDNSFQLYPAGGNRLMWMCSSGTCYVYVQLAYADLCPGPCYESSHPATSDEFWLRIRETSGTVYFEYSEDDTSSWTTAYSTSTATLPFAVSAVYVGLDVYEWSSTGAIIRDTAIFDEFNITPTTCDPYTTQCTEVFIKEGYDSWTAPTDVTSAKVACWGAGGGGGIISATGGAGGGGGAFASSTVSVTSGTSYTIFIASGGAADSAASTSDTTFATTTVVADGASGASPTAVATVGKGGFASASVGDVKYSGGNGGAGLGTDDTGGGGGGAAGPHGAGQTGSSSTATVGGAGGWGDNAAGGAGGAADTNGATTPAGGKGGTHDLGGGGAGGGDNGDPGGVAGGYGGGGGGGEVAGGGYGAHGRCEVSYTATAPATVTTTSSGTFFSYE